MVKENQTKEVGTLLSLIKKNDNTPKKFADIAQSFLKKIFIDEMGWEYNSDKIKITAMWSIINKKGSFNIQHNHPNAYFKCCILC